MFQALPRSILGIKCLFPWKWMMLTNCMSFSTSFLIEFVAMPTVACYRKGNMFLSREKCFSAALKSTAKYSSLFDLRPFVRNHEKQLDVHVTTRGKCYFLFLRDNISSMFMFLKVLLSPFLEDIEVSSCSHNQLFVFPVDHTKSTVTEFKCHTEYWSLSDLPYI